MRLTFWPLLLALSVFAGHGVRAQAPAGTIRGRVDIQRQPSSIERRPSVSELGMPTAHDGGEVRPAVVYLEFAPAAALSAVEIHSHMSAFILVFSHRYFAVTGPDGHYQIGRVPPGRYNLIAWNEGSVRESRPIVMPEDGGAVEEDFVIR
jgi:hypothetical protein